MAVVRAAGADLAAMRRGGSDGGGRGGGGGSGGAPRCVHRWGVTPSSAPSSVHPSAAAATAPRIVATATTPTPTPTHTSTPLFDATAAAAALLPLPQRFARSGAIAGMPLQLRNCSSSTGRGVAAAGAESGAEGGKEARGGGVAQELLAPWQARGDRSPLDLPYISPRSPLDLPYASPISPLDLPYISVAGVDDACGRAPCQPHRR